MLDKTVESLGGIQDELLIADGMINAVPQSGLPLTEEHIGEWFPDAHISSHVWDSQSVKRTWLLEKARSLRCDWLLQIDADERLHNGDRLKAWLPTWGGDAFPIPFQVEPWQLLCATWKCIRVGAWTRVAAGGAYIEHVDGTVYCVVPPDGRVPDGAEKFLPLLTHHPDERPPGRRDIRLGELENSLEPPPPDAPEYRPLDLRPRGLVQSPAVGATTNTVYYCDQCGARYGGPGVCDNGHTPNEVSPVGDDSSGDAGTAPDGAALASTGETTAATVPGADPSATAAPEAVDASPADPVPPPSIPDPADGTTAVGEAAEVGSADTAEAAPDGPSQPPEAPGWDGPVTGKTSTNPGWQWQATQAIANAQAALADAIAAINQAG
jgi:hypothetical protein